MKLKSQIAAITALALAFVGFDLAVYRIFTRRYIDLQSGEMKRQSVAVSENLPFSEPSGIVKIESDVRLAGELPVLDGAAALYPMYSAFVHAVYPPDSVSYNGTDFMPGSAMQYSNTRGAYQAVAEGKADVIFCAKPSAEQLEYAKKRGVELELVPIGKEAFVFLVNRQNPVNDLTVEQVRGIYAGTYTKWSEVGGDDSYIDAVQRNTGSGSQTTMLTFMDGQEMHRSWLGALHGRAIGYSFRYYSSGIASNPQVKMLSLNGVYPDETHIADGSYPVSSCFYAVYDKANGNENIPKLIDFILSPEGQRIVSESGYVPLNPEESVKAP